MQIAPRWVRVAPRWVYTATRWLHSAPRQVISAPRQFLYWLLHLDGCIPCLDGSYLHSDSYLSFSIVFPLLYVSCSAGVRHLNRAVCTGICLVFITYCTFYFRYVPCSARISAWLYRAFEQSSVCLHSLIICHPVAPGTLYHFITLYVFIVNASV